ncbi:MAG: aminopeptidase P family protein [Hyphomicrobiaceae bacterium]|nr:aminopeptidase P family protein [Hyphomicrobiaceae bacterium]
MFQLFDTASEKDKTAERIAQLRTHMRRRGLDAYLVPRADEHQGEYVPASSERLRWLTGFSGSAGFAVIGLDHAALFVDGRYVVQSRAEVDTSIFEILHVPTKGLKDWAADALKPGSTIGFDPWLVTLAQVEQHRADLKRHDIRFKEVAGNLVDRIWGKARPALPAAPVSLHPIAHAGESAADKIKRLQERLIADRHDAAILTQPDSICWLLNIRGSDVPHNPVVLAFAILHARSKPDLFIEPKKLTAESRKALKAVANLRTPDEMGPLIDSLKEAGRCIRLTPQTTAWWFARRIGTKHFARAPDPVVLPKAIKNPTEIAGARAAHLRDGVAVVRFLAWLDEAAKAKGGIDEIAAVEKLEALRAASGELKEISFDTISGSGPNGAIVHYRVSRATNRTLGKGELFLIDSGAQYIDGTTDITRTVAIGKPSEEMRQCFTRVLKGHIAIASARFPKGTRGVDLDSHARWALWQAGLDYDHGTGHGVGSYLSVHEGPQSLSRLGMVPLEPGMVLSNEPGYYKEGAFGIRIENLVLVGEPIVPEGGERPMHSFETLTLAPIDRRLVDKSLLESAERSWLDAYHAEVEERLAPHLDRDARDWLASACKPL